MQINKKIALLLYKLQNIDLEIFFIDNNNLEKEVKKLKQELKKLDENIKNLNNLIKEKQLSIKNLEG
jgi:wobble nucleotide-excising tRNase